MQEMHLGQPGVMYSVCQSFTKNKEKKKRWPGYYYYCSQELCIVSVSHLQKTKRKKNDGLDTSTPAARSYV